MKYTAICCCTSVCRNRDRSVSVEKKMRERVFLLTNGRGKIFHSDDSNREFIEKHAEKKNQINS